MKLTDAQFLHWLYERMIYVYKESPNVDFVQRIKQISDYLNKSDEQIDNQKQGGLW